MVIPEGHKIVTGFVPTNDVVFPLDGGPMAVAAVEEKVRRFTSIRGGQSYPVPVGRWRDGRFHLEDGRHTYIASLMLGRKTMLVAWVEPA